MRCFLITLANPSLPLEFYPGWISEQALDMEVWGVVTTPIRKV